MTRLRATAAVALSAGMLGARLASADVTIVETMTVTAGGKTLHGTRTTLIGGERMRIDTTLSTTETSATIFDVPAGVIVNLDANAKRAEIRAISARNADLEKDYPRARTVASLEPATGSRDVAGVKCDEHAFRIRVPMVKDGSIALVLAGAACIASGSAGEADYKTFADAAREHDVVLGSSSNNRIVLARTRAQTELYRLIAGAGGIPYTIDMTFTVDGHGVLSGIVRKALAGTQSVAVTSVATTTIPPPTFAVPDGYRRDLKK